MSGRLLGCWRDRSPEWYAAREGRVGGSDVGVIAGFSTYKTRDQLMAERLGLVERPPMTDAQRRGVYMEDAIRAFVAAEVDLDHEARGTYVDTDVPTRMCNPDDIGRDGTVWEYKAPAVRDLAHGWGRAGRHSDAVPLTYAAQAIWNAGILGATETRFCVWAGAPVFYPAFYAVKFDPNVYAYLCRAAADFLAELAARQLAQKEAA